jgi:TolA-binding protein
MRDQTTGLLHTSYRCHAVFLILAVAALDRAARADTVSIRRPNEPASIAPTVYTDVKITNIQDGRIVFTTGMGNSVDKDLASVVTMSIDDEPAFNQAEQDYAANRLDRAVDEFDQTIQKTDKTWLQAYTQPLLTDAANKAGRFDKAVEGYVNLVLNQPAAALQYRPTVPQPGSGYLDGAAKAISDAADTANISPQQQTALLSLLLEVDRARNDTSAIDSVATRLAKITGNSGSPNAALASVALADAKLSEANTALAQKNYDQAAAIINGSADLFVDPPRQADALFVLAQARAGQAHSKNDPDAWRDAAIAYMRVVASVKDLAGAPHVADSLLRTAAILDNHLNRPDKALQMYQSILNQFPHTTAADEAARQAARLQAAGARPG